MSKKTQEETELELNLETVAKHFGKEDIPTREVQVRYWKKLKYYWNNFSLIYWSDQDNNYRFYGAGVDTSNNGTGDQAYYDKPVNVFKAFLETIIAALSIQIPAISCVPDDADNPLDTDTAKAGNKISELVYKHNNVVLLWLRALYVYCTEGMVACYTYSEESDEYGTYEEDTYKDEKVEGYFCPTCQTELNEEDIIGAKLIQQNQSDKFDPNSDDVELDDLDSIGAAGETNDENEIPVCPKCALAIDSNLQKTALTVPRFTGTTTKPKSRICMEVYGGLYVKVANYAMAQKDTPYLEFSREMHYSYPLEKYGKDNPELYERLPKGASLQTGNNGDPWDAYARLNVQYRGTEPTDQVTVKDIWLRPVAFWILEKEKAEALAKKYPNGCRVTLVNDMIVHHCDEKLDDHWTLTVNPTSDYLTHEPAGQVLVNIQDIVNDLISLTIQTIEHGIPQLWVDPGVVNLDAYQQLETTPGTLTATKPLTSNKKVSEAFYSTTASNLPPETFQFYKIINELGQFVSGALPSLFGGNQAGSGSTASEYAMSRAMALQRQQTPWKMFTLWWKQIFSKVIPQYMDLMVYDERVVEKDEQGNFINVFIRKSELQGKIGSVELEASEKMPITEEQQKDVLLQLMQMNNQEIFSSLISPENLPYVSKVIGIPQFKLPGQDDRQKQHEEILELVNGTPIPLAPEVNPETGQVEQNEAPSVPIDPLIDNHQIEGDICRTWLISDAGRLCKKENPQGYLNVMLHYKEHLNALQAQQMLAQQNAAAMAGLSAGTEKKDKNNAEKQKPSGQAQKGPEKVKGESNVITPVQ